MSSLPARLRRWAHFRNPSFRSTQSVQSLPHYSVSSASDTSFNFERIFSAALAEYTKQTGKNLRNHPLANRIDSCNSAESILGIFEEQLRAFEIFRNGDIKQSKLVKWLKPVVNVLHTLSTNEVFKAFVGHAYPPAKAVFSGIGILLSATKHMEADYDALVDIFECIENFLRRLAIYTEIPPTPAMAEILIKIMVELLAVLALATKKINQRQFMKYAYSLLGNKDIESVMLRLDRLTNEESKVTAAQTLDVVYGLVKNMQVVMEDKKASTNDIQQTLILMQEMALKVNQLERDHLQESFRRWLSAPDPWVNHNLARKAHHRGTATWFTQGDTMNNWKSTGSLMWIHGLPGSGKSVLCSAIVQEVQDVSRTGLATLAFFYFDFRDAAKQDVRSLLSSLLIQLSNRSNNFCKILSELYSAHSRGSQQPSEDALTECLKEILKLPGQGEIYIVVDALDECPNLSGYPTPREQVLIILQELIDLRLPHVHFCIMSRPEVDIQDAVQPLADHNVSLHEQAGQNRDISDYIKSVVYSDPKMRRWREEDRQLVIKTLIEKAGGMFRWVYCQIETIRRCFPASIRRALEELPETLDGTYEQTLRMIDKQKRDYAYRLFQCIVVSKRPLRVEELAELFAIQPNAQTIPTFDAHLRPENPEEFVLSACTTLVAVVNVDGQKIVQFSHFSVREYLVSHRITTSEHVLRFQVLPRPAHALLATACLSVLLQLDDRVDRDNIGNFPLSLYAAQYWIDHARFENVSLDIRHGMDCLFDRNKPHLAAWLRLFNIDDTSEVYGAAPIHIARSRAVPLYYAALCGFRDIAEDLANAHPQDVNAQGGSHVTPLRAALEKGHRSVAMLLLERGADLGSRDSRSRTILHIAAYHGYPEVVSFLIDHGADTNSEELKQQTPLHLASEKGHEEIVRLLLDNGADANHLDNSGSTPLLLASETGHEEVVRLFLDRGADANHLNNSGSAPLRLTLETGHEEVARALLDHGADANHQGIDGLTPLCLALKKGYKGTVLLLLDCGADANHLDNSGSTPLRLALETGDEEISRALLDHGANVNLRDIDGLTVLHRASLRNHNDTIQFLLNHAADVNYPDFDGLTPLHHASLRGHDETIQLLLDHGADVNHADIDGLTPLDHARREGHNNTVRLLLHHGAVANRLGNGSARLQDVFHRRRATTNRNPAHG